MLRMATYLRQIWCGILSVCAKNVAGWVFGGGVKNPTWVSVLDFLHAPCCAHYFFEIYGGDLRSLPAGLKKTAASC